MADENETDDDEEENGAELAYNEEVEDFFSSYSQNHMNINNTRGPSRYFSQAFGWDEDEFGPDPLTTFRTSADFGQQESGSLDEAVMKSREMVGAIGTLNSGHGNVPINPMGIPEKRAAAVAQSMIERMSNIEDDETRMQDEFKYDTKRLLKLQLNPMRGVQSAKVGRSKAPIAIFLDYSGSCSHVSNLFGLIMVGFANEGATILIGGNGVVNAVYHPFPNRPLFHYALDMKAIAHMDFEKTVRVKAGIIVRCEGANLQDLSVGPLIACTDFDSYEALMARPRNSTHIVLSLHPQHSKNVRSVMAQGQVDIGGDPKTWWNNHASAAHKKTDITIYTNTQNLALLQRVYMVHDLETLTDTLRSSR